MENIRGFGLVIVVVAAFLLFGGAKKLPDAARGLGRSLRIFKAETKGLIEDEASGTPAEVEAAPAAPAQTTVLPVESQAAVASPSAGLPRAGGDERPTVS